MLGVDIDSGKIWTSGSAAPTHKVTCTLYFHKVYGGAFYLFGGLRLDQRCTVSTIILGINALCTAWYGFMLLYCWV